MNTWQTTNLIHRSDVLHQNTGTFFHRIYEGRDQVQRFLDSLCWLHQQTLIDASEAARLPVRTVMPVFHREWVVPVRVSEREFQEGKDRLLTYGTEGLRYGQNHYYGNPSTEISGGVEIPDKIVDADICCDLPVDPSVVLLNHEDFFLKDGVLFFSEDIFQLFSRRLPQDDDILLFYLRGVAFDHSFIQDRLSVLLGTEGKSSESFLELNQLIMDCLHEGTSRQRLSRILAILFETPCAKEKEVVEFLGENEKTKWIITDRNVYTASRASEMTVSLGETVEAGTFLADSLQKVQGDRDLFLSREFLGPDYTAGLIFPKDEVPLIFQPDFPHPVFEIRGRKDDVLRFWTKFYHNAALAEGDRVSPARWVYENFLYPAVCLYQVDKKKLTDYQTNSPAINMSLIRNLLPPGMFFSLIILNPLIESPPFSFQGNIEQLQWNSVLTLPEMRLTALLTDFTLFEK